MRRRLSRMAGVLRRGHDRHEHGRPRYRHHPRRQPGPAGGRDSPQERRRHDRRAPRRRQQRSGQEAKEIWQDDHDRVVEAGGLHIVGTERHESRRIDNQLRGRAGRQGDPGSSRFFVSFGDDLMKRFSPEWVPNLLGKMGMDEDDAAGERHGVQGHRAGADEGGRPQLRHPQARRPVRRRDEPAPRRHLQDSAARSWTKPTSARTSLEMVEKEIERAFDAFAPGDNPANWDTEGLLAELKTIVPPLPPTFTRGAPRRARRSGDGRSHRRDARGLREEGTGAGCGTNAHAGAACRCCGTIDRLWVYHLTELDAMRQGIGLQGYGGRDPLVEFKREALRHVRPAHAAHPARTWRVASST